MLHALPTISAFVAKFSAALCLSIIFFVLRQCPFLGSAKKSAHLLTG
jgi:hypothetical protein